MLDWLCTQPVGFKRLILTEEMRATENLTLADVLQKPFEVTRPMKYNNNNNNNNNNNTFCSVFYKCVTFREKNVGCG